MADSNRKKAKNIDFITKVKAFFSSLKKRLAPFIAKANQFLKAVFLKITPFCKKILHSAGQFLRKLHDRFALLSGDKKLVLSGSSAIVLSAIVFALAYVIPPKQDDPFNPLVLETELLPKDDLGADAFSGEVISSTFAPNITPSPAPFTEPLSKGADGPLIATMQSRLMVLGYMDDDEPTEHFGNLTKDALTTFQKHHNLPADGILQEATYSILFSPAAQAFVLQSGDSGEDVSDVQARLYELGYLSRDFITGTFGEKTETAVKDFQKSNNLSDDGKVGTETLETLYSENVVGNFYKKGESSDTVKSYQERLVEKGYLSSDSKLTGKMDNQTIAAIKSFQEKNDLVADGCLGPSTMAKLDSSSSVSYAYQLGMKGSSIKDLQKRLYDLGYLKKNQITGYYGEATEDAVKDFQHRNDLKEDGQVGSKTLQKLNSDSALKAKVTTVTTKSAKKTAKATSKSKTKATPTKSSSKKTATATPKKKATATPKKATATPKPSASKADQIVNVAKTKLGCPYVRGKKGPDSFDCSGFVYWCLKQVGVNQSYMTSIGWRKTSKYTRFTKLSEAKKGDVLVFSGSTDSTGHVGLCIGSGSMIDASSSAGQIRTTSLSGNYWKVHFICGYHIWD